MTILSRSYRWSTNATNSTSGGSLISGENSPFYTTKVADIGKYLFMEEKPVNEAGGTTWFPSNVIGPIVAAGETYVAQAGTIAPLTSAIGGRPIKPYEAVWDFENTFFDAARQSHMALHKALCDDIEINQPAKFTKTVKAGVASDSTVWSNGLPRASVPYVCADHDLIWDMYLTDALECLVYHRRFTFDTTADRLIRCDTILGMAGSYWGMGSKASPVPESTTSGRGRIEIRWKPGTGAPGSTPKLGYMTAGEVEWCGADKPEVLTCSSDPGVSDTVLHLAGDLTKWRVGDEIIIESQADYTGNANTDASYTGPTTYYLKAGFDGATPETAPYMGYKISQDEHRTITAIDAAGGTVTIDSGLTYAHPTRTPVHAFLDGRVAPSIKPQVSNLSRSIRFIGEGDPSVLQQRAHGMFMQCSRIDVRHVQSVDMGRTDVNPSLTSFNSPAYVTSDSGYTTPINDPNNVRGRYSWHIHGVGRNNDRIPAVLENCTAHKSRGTIHPLPGWVFTHHNSRAFMHRCIGYGGRGGGMVTELGTEVGQWINCRMLHMRGDWSPFGYGRRNDLVQNMNAHMGCGYDLQSRAILMQGCVAKSCKVHTISVTNNGGYGNEPVRAPDLQAIRLINPIMLGGTAYAEDPYWGTDKYLNNQAQPPDWNNQLALDCQYGFFVAERHRIFRYDMTPMIAIGFTCYGVTEPVFILDYSWHYYFYDIVVFGSTGSDRVIYIGPKGGHMHIARGIVEGRSKCFDGDPNHYAAAIDIAGGSVTDAILSSSITGAANPPTFVIDNPSPPDTGSSVHLADLGGKKLQLDYYGPRHTADPMRGQVQFDGVWTDGAGSAPWPFLKEIDYIQYAMVSSSPADVIVTLNGCFNASGTWKTRLWFVNADRFPPLVSGKPTPHFAFPIDVPLVNFPSAFLTANTIQPNDGQPVMPFLPEDINKPHSPVQVPSNISPPFIIGPLVDGRSVRVNVGTWSPYPAEVDDWLFSWKANGVEFADTRIASLTGQAGKTITCDVTAVNTATPGEDNGVTVTALYSGVCAAAPTSLATIWGSALKDFWQLDKIPVHTGADLRLVADGGNQIADNVLVDGQMFLNYWYGINGTQMSAAGTVQWQKFGWDGKPCLYLDGRKGSPSHLETFISGVVNPIVWVVMERDSAAVDAVYPDYAVVINASPFFITQMEQVTNDATQTHIHDRVNSLTAAGFGEGARAVIQSGAGPGAARLSVNNGNVQTASVSTPATTSVTFQIGSKPSDAFPEPMMKGKIRAVLIVDTNGATPTAQQFADTQTFLSKLL